MLLASSLEETGGMGVPYRPPFPHNGPVFNKCPRLISKDLITARHQRGICESNSEFMGMNGKRKKLRNRIFGLGEGENRSRSGFSYPSSRFLGNLPKTQIDLNRSMSAKACWRQPRITPGKGRRTLADLRVAILFSGCIGDLSRVGVRVQRLGNGNPAREDIN